jgi:ABC-type branched-subunit amino acid transport system permease subunit
MTLGSYGIVRSRHGRAFIAVRDDDVASGLMGIDVVRTKAAAFLIGAFYAGIGGALWAYYVRFVAVDQFTLFHSIWFIAMVIVGGMGRSPGRWSGFSSSRPFRRRLLRLARRWFSNSRRSGRCRIRHDERLSRRHYRDVPDLRAARTDASLEHSQAIIPAVAVSLLRTMRRQGRFNCDSSRKQRSAQMILLKCTKVVGAIAALGFDRADHL